MEVNSDDWTAVHQCAGFDGHHGLSILDGANFERATVGATTPDRIALFFTGLFALFGTS